MLHQLDLQFSQVHPLHLSEADTEGSFVFPSIFTLRGFGIREEPQYFSVSSWNGPNNLLNNTITVVVYDPIFRRSRIEVDWLVCISSRWLRRCCS